MNPWSAAGDTVDEREGDQTTTLSVGEVMIGGTNIGMVITGRQLIILLKAWGDEYTHL